MEFPWYKRERPGINRLTERADCQQRERKCSVRIKEIRAHRVELPLHEGAYRWSGGKSVTVFDSTIVAITTDDGLTGYGEGCPLGPAYLAAYAAGLRTGIAELGPVLLGLCPTDLA